MFFPKVNPQIEVSGIVLVGLFDRDSLISPIQAWLEFTEGDEARLSKYGTADKRPKLISL